MIQLLARWPWYSTGVFAGYTVWFYNRTLRYVDRSFTSTQPCKDKNGCDGTQYVLTPRLTILVSETYWGFTDTYEGFECSKQIICPCEKTK